jgi:hypothetical protein
MSAMDRDARKQVLLTRIAFERIELRRDLARVQEAASVPNLVRAAVGENVGRALLGAMLPGKTSWLPLAMSMLKKYKVVATLAAGFAPGVTFRGLKSLTKYAGIASAVWFGWRAFSAFRGARDAQDPNHEP